MNSEPFALMTATGVEVTDNERTVKFVVREFAQFVCLAEQHGYLAHLWVRNGSGWERTTETRVYFGLNQFIDSIRNLPHFSKAMHELSRANQDE